jgi:Cof subfamily protein (haloacid dehalogenase superfamily)
MYRLIALDVDGTLLNTHHQLSEVNAQAVLDAQSRGMHVVLATGKQYVGIVPLIERFGLTAPQITSHGALVTDPSTGTPLYERGIPVTAGRKAFTIAQELDVTMVVAGHGKTWATAHNHDIDYMLTYGDPVPTILDDLAQALTPPPTHLIALAYQQDRLYKTAYKRFAAELDGHLNVYKSSPYYIEFLHPAASKGNALAHVCDQLEITADEVVAVGDSFNDMSMLDYAGLSVAMGNSPEELKRNADRITLSNDEDGVAHLIHDLLTSP